MGETKKTKRQSNYRIREDLVEQMEHHVKNGGCTKTAIIEEALERFLPELSARQLRELQTKLEAEKRRQARH